MMKTTMVTMVVITMKPDHSGGQTQARGTRLGSDLSRLFLQVYISSQYEIGLFSCLERDLTDYS